MTDLLYVVVTLAAFAGLALLVGALDRADQRSAQEGDR
jgi:hypothetical protein